MIALTCVALGGLEGPFKSRDPQVLGIIGNHAKVDELYLPIVRDHDVLNFQVAVEDA